MRSQGRVIHYEANPNWYCFVPPSLPSRSSPGVKNLPVHGLTTPDPHCPDRLEDWRTAPRHPLPRPHSALERRLLEAIARGETLAIRYITGLAYSEVRRIRPLRLLQAEGFSPVYLEAHCDPRGGPRTFRLDRLRLD